MPSRISMLVRLVSVLAVAVGLLGIARDARADIPTAEDGEGIKVGQRSTFHPGFALVTGVDSNVFYNAGQEGTQAASFISPTAWLGIGNRQVRDGILMSPPERSARIVDYSIRAVSNFRQYLARKETILRQSRLSGGATLRLAFLPGRKFEVDVAEDFFRFAQPSNLDAGAGFNFNRLEQRGSLKLIGRPGGGRVSLGLAFKNQVLVFENQDERTIFRNNRTTNGAQTEIKWRFLPKSALFFSYDFGWTFYLGCCESIGRGRNEDNFAHRLTGGYRGQLLKKVALDATVGWGFGFYRDDPNGPNFNSVIGHVGFDYFPTLRTLVHLGGYRSFSDSLLGNYFVDNGGRVAVKHQWRWRMITGVGANIAGRRYSGLPVPGFEDEEIDEYVGAGADGFRRTDTIFQLDAKIEQPVRRIWSFGVQYKLTVDDTTFATFFVPGPDDSGRPQDIAGFNKHVVLGFAAVRI